MLTKHVMETWILNSQGIGKVKLPTAFHTFHLKLLKTFQN